MGIEGLWKVLEPVSEQQPLQAYAWMQSLQHGENGEYHLKPILVGIDASIWMNESQAAFHHHRHPQMGENPELRTLFYRLAHLLNIYMVPVFVFDGPCRPEKKRGKKVVTHPHWLTSRFKDMIRAFGFHAHTAPGEAEAELALLNRVHIFHSIVTEDSDAFVFGATCVIRKPEDKAKSSSERVYTAERAVDRLGMQQNDFLFVATLVGGDYDEAGLEGCGATTAFQLVSLHIGDHFHRAAEDLPNHQAQQSLDTARTVLRCEFANNLSNCLRRRHTNLANSIPDSFPSLDTLHRYVNPIVSSAEEFQLFAEVWEPQLPDVGRLFSICEDLFTWGTAEGILKKFQSLVWAGVCLRQVIQFYQSRRDVEIILIPRSAFLSAHKPSRQRKASTPEVYDVKVNLRPLIQSSLKCIRHTREDETQDENYLLAKYGEFTAKLPMLLVHGALPNLFKNSSSQSAPLHVAPSRKRKHSEVIDLTS